MRTFPKRTGWAALAALAVLGTALPAAQAQPQGNPYFRVAPGLTAQQAAYNTIVMDRALQNAAVLRATTTLPGLAAATNPYVNPYPNPYTTAAYGIGLTNPYTGLSNVPGNPVDSASSNTNYPSYNNSSYYPNPYSSYTDPYGGFMSGVANIISASGRDLINQNKARFAFEQVRQARVDTRRRIFDEIMYERMNTPSFTEMEAKIAKLRLSRMQNTPMITEIWSGNSLNVILDELRKLPPDKLQGPEIPLDKGALERLNVTSGKGTANVGLLKKSDRLPWPQALKELQPEERVSELRTKIESLTQDAVGQASKGNGIVREGVVGELQKLVDELRALLVRKVNEVPTSEYIEAKGFLNNFDDAIKTLRNAQEAANAFNFNQNFVGEGKDVKQLILYMVRHGLRFAPATAGDEFAYQAVHSALAQFSLASQGQQLATKEGQ